MIDVEVVCSKEEFHLLKNRQQTWCNYIYEYDKDWDIFPCLVVLDSYDDSNGPYVFTFDFFDLNELDLKLDK